MRRKDRKLKDLPAWEVVDQAVFATLSTTNEDGSPYGVPISFAREGNRIYMHGALQGQKIENLQRDPRVCLSFVGRVQVPELTPEERLELLESPQAVRRLASKLFTTQFSSALIQGHCRIVEDPEEKIHALELLSRRYVPENMEHFQEAAEMSLRVTAIMAVEAQEITGKRKWYGADGKEEKGE